MEQITTIAEFEQQLEQDQPFFLLKHSTTCPVSAAAFEQYSIFLQEPGSTPGVYLAVQQSRELSNHIAAVTGIRHESPQVIFFKQGKPEWSESHWKITKETLSAVQ